MSETAEQSKFFLEKVHLKGYKSIEDLSIDLKDGMNILIGKNGSGKSNFLEFLNKALLSVYKEQDFIFKSAELSFIQGNDVTLYAIEKLNKRITSSEGAEILRFPINKKLTINSELVYDNLRDEVRSENIIYNERGIRAGKSLRTTFNLMRVSLFPMYIEYNLPQYFMSGGDSASVIISDTDWEMWEISNGTNLINVVIDEIENNLINEFGEAFYEDGELEGEDRAAKLRKFLFDKITKSVMLEKLVVKQEIIDNLSQFSPIKAVRFNENINIYKDDKRITIENLKLEYLVNDNWIPWSYLSDGTKRIFYIITSVISKKNGLILIEEPELGIHPHQFELLMQFLKEQSQYKQFIISTHSPKTLDHLNENELDNILVASYEKEKGTVLTRLSEEQQLKAKDYMKEVGYLSDYWLMSDLEA